MKKKLSLRPVKKLALSRDTVARLDGEPVSRLDLVAVNGGSRASWASHNSGDSVP